MSKDGGLGREDEALVEQAKAILSLNWTGEYTQPGPRLYPHQWSWDSALIATAYAHYDRGRAERELRHLFGAQWSNGLLPQIVFNPRFRDYFPVPSFWNASESPHAPTRYETSGVVMPPVHATAVLAVYKGSGEEAVINYSRHEDAAQQVVEKIEGAGGRGLVVGADVSDPKEVEAMIQQAADAFGRLDIMVNNAGMERKMPFLETPFEVWQETIAVNLTGTWLGCQAAAKRMVAQGGPGRIINVSSVHEDLAMPTNAPYCATKGGVRMLMRTLAVELAPHDITVNNIAPAPSIHPWMLH